MELRPEPPFLGPLRPVRPPNTFLEEEDAEADAADQTEPVEADEEEEVEEALVAKLLRSPTAPTAAERAAHAPTHLPYRSWCDECVAGRRDNPAHRHVEHQENSVHEVMMDYCFLRRQDEEEVITILVLKERQSRAIQAWVVPNKSILFDEGAAAERAVEGIRRFGFRNKLILKVDNENAILALRTLLLDKLGMSALEEEPHPHESQSNGAVENGVRLTKGLLRVHLLALERTLGHRVPSKHPILAWLVEHVADTATKYLKGADGRTAYERLFLWKRAGQQASGSAELGAPHTTGSATANPCGKPERCNGDQRPTVGTLTCWEPYEPRRGATQPSPLARSQQQSSHPSQQRSVPLRTPQTRRAAP